MESIFFFPLTFSNWNPRKRLGKGDDRYGVERMDGNDRWKKRFSLHDRMIFFHYLGSNSFLGSHVGIVRKEEYFLSLAFIWSYVTMILFHAEVLPQKNGMKKKTFAKTSGQNLYQKLLVYNSVYWKSLLTIVATIKLLWYLGLNCR